MPIQANDGLLIANRKIAPGKHLKQLAITPKLEPIISLTATGLNHQKMLHRVAFFLAGTLDFLYSVENESSTQVHED